MVFVDNFHLAGLSEFYIVNGTGEWKMALESCTGIPLSIFAIQNLYEATAFLVYENFIDVDRSYLKYVLYNLPKNIIVRESNTWFELEIKLTFRYKLWSFWFILRDLVRISFTSETYIAIHLVKENLRCTGNSFAIS